MISGIYNFTVDQGATFNRHIAVTNPDNSVFDLTGYSARMQIRRDIASTVVMLELTTDNGFLTVNGSSGTIDVYMTPAETSLLDRDGVYDLEIYDTDGVVYRLIRGVVRVNLEVTR